MEEKVIYHVGSNGLSWPTDSIFEDEKRVNTIQDAIVYINIKTLLRNALAAYDDSKNLKKALLTIKDRIDSDIMLFREYMSNNHNSRVVIFDVNYNNVKASNFVKLKEAKTDKQKLNKEVFDEAFKLILGFVEKSFSSEFSNPNQGDRSPAYILTHMAIDLLRVHSFNNLKLLDSFSGAIKDFKEFNSKLTIDKSLRELIPLTETTIRIFGDGELFSPQPKAVKTIILDIAKKSNWTPLTTDSRVMFSIKRHDPQLADILKNITRS